MARLPDYRLKVLHKPTDRTGFVGAVWKNATGSLLLVLDPGASPVFDPDIVYTLFPVVEGGGDDTKTGPTFPDPAASVDDDIPL